jgi:threonine synthase
MSHDLRCTVCKDVKKHDRTGRCGICGGTLECVYPRHAFDALAEQKNTQGLARFAPVLPLDKEFLPFLGESQTPLLRSRVISKQLGLKNLFFKDESRNPTGSFKDRAICIAVGLAMRTKSKGIMTVSSGNAAASLSTYAAACQLPCLVLVDSDASTHKLQHILYMGAQCITVQGIFERGFEPLCDLVTEVSQYLNYWCAFSWAPLNPYSVEGTKTIAYECACIKPDVVICPVAGGDNLAGQWKGYNELYEAGIIEKRPKMIGVQPKGSAPLALAYNRRERHVTPIAKATTVASGLRTTFSGDHALKAVYESNGCATEVDDRDTIRCKNKLAKSEGIWTESSSAVTVAALPSLIESKFLDPHEKIICVLTGAGHKEQIDLDIRPRLQEADFDRDDILRKFLQLVS